MIFFQKSNHFLQILNVFQKSVKIVKNFHQKLSSTIVIKNCHQCLKGHRSLGSLFNVNKNKKWVSESVSDKVTYWAVRWQLKISPLTHFHFWYFQPYLFALLVWLFPCRQDVKNRKEVKPCINLTVMCLQLER